MAEANVISASVYNAAVAVLAEQVVAMAQADADEGADDQVRIFCEAYAASAADDIAALAKELA